MTVSSMRYGFAHRGGAHGAENTIATFAEALARGARGLETDAWLSLDGQVILDHDGIADHTSGQSIANVGRDELPAHMATLDELYDQCGTDFSLAIDVKTAVVAAALVETATRHDAADNLWVVAPTVGQLSDISGAHRVVTVRGNILRARERRTVLAAAHDIGIEAINARWMWWNRSIVAEVHALGMLAFGYDAQRPFSLNRSVRIGLDGVFSDHIDRMLAALIKAM